MSDLVKRLRGVTESDAYALPWTFGQTCKEAADLIEELERELARLCGDLQSTLADTMRIKDQLAAEKALADRLWATLEYFGALRNGYFEQSDIAAAYRKARGM